MAISTLHSTTSSVAVIGNGRSLLDFSLGAQIDKTDLVIRMNNFNISEKHRIHSGSKTDIYMHNFFEDVATKQSDLRSLDVKEIWSSIAISSYKPRWKSMIQSGREKFDELPIVFPSELDLFMVSTPRSNLENYFRYIVFKYAGQKMFDRFYARVVPSTGLVAIYMALKLRPKTILIAGFDFFSLPLAYYFDDETTPPNDTHHEFAEEAKTIRRIVMTNKHVAFTLAVPDTIQPHFQNLENLTLL